jgi:hypothetical protein
MSYGFSRITVTTSIGAKLIKTGQTTSYRTGDDGDIEAGRETSFLVLASNNPFGSTSRFTSEVGNQTYTNNWVIDWGTYDGITVLGYFKTLQAAASWNDAIDNSLGTFGTFSNCRLQNIREALNIENFGVATRLNYAPFNDSTAELIWTSTTHTATTQALVVNKNNGTLIEQNKTNLLKYRPVRTFTVTGTTLT